MRSSGLLAAVCLFATQIIVAQTAYDTKLPAPVVKAATVNMSDYVISESHLEYVNMPKPGGDSYHEFLKEQKALSAERFPVRDAQRIESRSFAEPPELVRGFTGNSWTSGIPLDNHLALNNNGQIVSVVNTQMLVVEPTGVWVESYNLDNFWEELGEVQFYFDPRVIYDPIEDKFIMVMMQDSDCEGSNIVFAFTETNDPTGVWHLYQFEGCPNQDATFADFPMIALTQEELFFTYNAVFEDSTWQTGFKQTLIYQINKSDGYSGSELNWRSWENINHNGVGLRYLCPIKYPTEELGTEVYFLSNRSFDIENDTFFMAHINGVLDDADTELTTIALTTNTPYGVPPNAAQPKDFLQTNDARVLDGFIVDDEIQFVCNTVDPETGLCAVYHGIVSFVNTEPLLQGVVLRNGADHLAYPGIAYTGATPDERDAIIMAAHASPERFPGYSALYYDGDHSEWITVVEGSRIIDLIKPDNPFGIDPTLERWGDYSGIQRDLTTMEGTVWTSSCYGKPGNVHQTWIANLMRPQESTSVSDVKKEEIAINAFPNPVNSILTVDIEAVGAGDRFEALLADINGQLISVIREERLNRSGPIRFYYDTSGLTAGTYLLTITIEGKPTATREIVVTQ